MEYERFVNGIVKYINAEIYTTMTDWQEMIARLAVSRILGNGESFKKSLVNNAFLRTFAIIDESGNIDAEGLMRDLKEQIAAKGQIKISLPLMPTLTFTPEDVDKLTQYILR